MTPKKKALLVVLDGWGVRRSRKDNAILQADTPNFDRLWKENPHTTLFASAQHVGLPKGFIGNSEVGHINLGAGRVISQELMKIDQEIKRGTFQKNRVILDALKKAGRKGSSLHLIGLLSDAGVHSHINHLFILLEMAKRAKVERAYIHCFLDGRDVQPKSAMRYIRRLEDRCAKLGIGSIATLMGRFYAMDRDNRWNREHKAYDAMVNHQGRIYGSAEEAVNDAYSRGETDEFVQPSIILSKHKKAKHQVQKDDSVIFFNFREDRARELTRAFVQGRFKKFKRKRLLDLHFVCLTQYDKDIKAPVALPPDVPEDVLGQVMAKNNLRQLRIAETEKYAHVTYFFNGGKDGPFPKEDRVMIPSPKVETYDEAPEMSAPKIAEEAAKRLKTDKYDLVILNFANADMVGHTGMIAPTIKAVNTVDTCLGKVVAAAISAGYEVVITADHGNAEEMSGKHMTSHTMNKVPFIVLSDRQWKINHWRDNSIADIAPTVLKLMGLPAPESYFKPLIR
ncbi:MAG: 2,3-bisphosphoglycerate-independent phosphoglycerate mutase [Candidatus Woesearchaeota archaeon]